MFFFARDHSFKRPFLFALFAAFFILFPAQLRANDAPSMVHIESGTIASAIISLAQQTGANIGIAGEMPRTEIKGFTAKLTVDEALARILAKTHWRARRLGPYLWRVEKAASPPQPRPKPIKKAQKPPAIAADAPTAEAQGELITVIASKQNTLLQKAPFSVELIAANSLAHLPINADTSDLVRLSNGLVQTSLGPGLNRNFIRGVGDSPFNGLSQSTVALEVDEARITYNAPDPNLKLVDVDHVEILEGPQGPLHGTGALGGVYRIVTKAPNLDEASGAIALEGSASSVVSSTEGTGSLILNLPIAAEKLALRIAAYGAAHGGWIDNGGLQEKGTNSGQFYGLRAAMLWQINADMKAQISTLWQRNSADDSQWSSSSAHPYLRLSGLKEPHHNHIMQTALTLGKQLGDTEFTSTTSITRQDVFRSSDASTSAALFGLDGPVLYHDARDYQLINQELRASSSAGRLKWLGGGSYLGSDMKLDASLMQAKSAALTVGEMQMVNSEWAMFGNISFSLRPNLELSAGSRLFYSSAENETHSRRNDRHTSKSHWGMTPSASLNWQTSDALFLYLRYAAAYRPGGVNPFAENEQSENYASDKIHSLELGGRIKPVSNIWNVGATLFGQHWGHVQADNILPNGLIETRNVGNAMIIGTEAHGAFRPDDGWEFLAGVNFQHAKLEKILGSGELIPADYQLPIVQPYKAYASVLRHFRLGPFGGQSEIRANFAGASTLTIDPVYTRKIPAFEEISWRISLSLNDWSADAEISNLLGEKTDIFPYGNPFSYREISQHTPMEPRRVRLSLRTKF